MENIFNIFSYLGIFSICILIIITWLLWLFIRSAVASGTKKGIIDAYETINKYKDEDSLSDFEKEMKGWE